MLLVMFSARLQGRRCMLVCLKSCTASNVYVSPLGLIQLLCQFDALRQDVAYRHRSYEYNIVSLLRKQRT